MRRILYAIAALAVFTATSCNKEDEDINNVPDKGAIRFVNTSSDLYDIYLDDFKYGNLYGGDSSFYPNIVIGSHKVKAIQVGNVGSGTPILKQQVVIVEKDSVAVFRFP
jgi:hypothetical protein